MATEAKSVNYWISSTALYIQLNAMGESNYIQCSVVSGASVLCYMSDVPGLGYDAGHNYQRWTLAAYPSIFPDSARKYVYIAIPRQSTTDNNQATVVFPGQKIDIYGKTIPSSGTEGVQIGNEAYYYIFTGGIISAVKTDADNTRKREWEQHFECGKLATDEAIASGGEGAWWRYNSVSDTITFLKEILNATFNELSAKVARVTSLFLGGHELKGVADSNGTLETSNDTVVTPQYLGLFGVKHFLAKDKDDTAHGTITWEKVQKFFSGLHVGNSNNENGGSWTPDAEGRSHLITDYLEVRMKAIFEELVINKTSTIGGKEIISPAGGVVAHKVEEVTVTYNNVSQKAYRCYFLAEQEGDAVDNDFAVGDQVRSESFNVRKGTYHKAGNHFYWRLVIGRDEDPVEQEGKKYHYIDLSDTDCATASDVPAKGDVLNQCGNRTDVERQNCLIFSAVDTYSPSISLYHGINSYSFANREYVEYGVNKQNNKAFFNVYGDMYVGDRPTKENGYEGSSYIRYDSSTKQLSVKGKISAKSTVDGKELSQYFNKIAELQNQVDGAIETWFYDGVPTLKNAPAISWKTDDDKKIHLGDLYYNNKTGKAYRFAKDSNTYKWTLITDTDIAKALSDARMAQETANGKMKVFSVQPTTPYQVGDIWVNATYPSDGSTYKNEVLRCQTKKAAGSLFAIADWIKASRYTDDTVANAAKTTAEKAQKAAEKAQGDISKLGTTVTDNKKAFDNYVKDGYLEPSEIAAMAQDSKRLEDDFAAAQKSYNEVKDAEVLKGTKELTDLTSAFTTLTTAKKELVNYLSDISSRYNAADTNGKATIVSAVGTKFTNFQSAYASFYDKLGLANAYITSKIYGNLGVVIGDVTSLAYLKKALMDALDTEINGGLVLTSLIGLRDTDGNTTAGINGITEKSAKGGGVAAWFGGEMVDKDYNDGSKTPANTIFRFDGSGYVAGGAIWWGTDGRIHADPTSFIISEKNLGAYLTFFEPTWKAGSAGTSVADLVSLKPNAPFTKLGVSGDATFEGAISFHGIKLTYDATNKAIKVDGNLYATGGITAYGASSVAGGGGGLNGSVKAYADATRLTTENLSEIASAYSVAKLYSEIQNVASAVPSISVSVPTGGNALTGATYDASTGVITFAKGTFLTAHQSLDGYVNAIAVSGSGNAVTAVTKSGKTITFTKGATYLTSHQSLSNYYTKSSVDSLLNGKSATTHTHSVKINGITKTIAASGGDAVDLGTYLTTHQSLAAYATQNWVKNEATAHNADMVDNYHASGLFTGFSISDVANKVTISIGGTSKALNLVRAFPNGGGNNFNDIATHGNSMGMSDIAAPYASSTANHQTLNGYVNPNGQTGWHHYINLSYTDSNNTATSPNMWQTQFAIKAGTTEVYVRSRAGGKISNSAAWAAPWVRLARVTDNVASASKVANALSWSGYSSGSYNGSAAKSISIPNNTNQLTNGAGFITSSASISGNAATATNADKLDGVHANGLLTALSNSDKGISITVGGTTKSVSNISVNYASSAGNADTVDGYHESSFLRYRGNYEDASVTKDGVGVYGWAHTNTGHNNFHESYGDIINIQGFSTWRTRFDIGTSGRIRIVHGINTTTATQVGYLAYLHDNVASASKLATARSIWGQSFDGTGNVNGTIYINNSDSENGAIILNNNVNTNARISAIKDQVVFNTGAAIRFGATNWEYSDWAGLKYDTVANAIYLGIADGTVFNYSSNKRSNGTLKFPGITTITPDSGARIGGSGGNLYLGNANNSGWVCTQDICSQINSSYWNITQNGSATFKSLTVSDVISCNSISVSKNAVIAGNLSVDGLINNKGILPTNYEVNNKGTNCYVSADALCSGITAITDSIPVDNLSIVYSNDNGTNWTNYNISNDTKFKAYANVAGIDSLTLGGNVITGNNDAEKLAQIKKNQLMFTFNVPNGCYSQVYFASVDITQGIGVTCTVEYLNSKGVIVNTFIKYMNGWSQLNYINLSNGNESFPVGNDSRRYIRFKFKHDQNTTELRNASINKIRIFAFTKYSYPTDRFMGHTGHIYNFDYNMNTYFPNSILAKGGVTAYQSSDIRLKQDLRKLDYLGIIKAMGGTYGFAWKKDNTRSIGWIAQHVLCNPHLKDIVETDEKGYYKINYWSPKLIATAFGAIEQVGDEVSRLKARVVFLESEVQRLSGDKEDCNKKRLDNKNINSLN